MQQAILGILVMAALSGPVAAAESVLTIEANGFASDHGHAVARIYVAGDDVMGNPRWSLRAAIEGGRARFTQSLPLGHYAVVVYHDINDNGRLDHNFLGFPAEPLGFSGGFTLSLTSGLPSFTKLRFELPADGATLQIHVH